MRVEGEEGWPGQSLRCPGELATYPSCTRQTSDVSTGRQIVGRARARNSPSILLTTPKQTIHYAESAPMSKVANGVGVKVLRKIFFFEAVQRNGPLSPDDILTLVATIQLTPPAAPRAPSHASDRNRRITAPTRFRTARLAASSQTAGAIWCRVPWAARPPLLRCDPVDAILSLSCMPTQSRGHGTRPTVATG